MPACRPHEERPPADQVALPPLHVVASTPILAELAGAVAGETHEIHSLLERGERATSLVRTGPRETALMSADVIVGLGWGLEAALAPSVEKAVAEGAVWLELASFFPPERLLPQVGEGTGIDPHVWLDPELWRLAVAPLVEAFTRLRPESASGFTTRGHMARFELDALAEEVRHRAEVVASSSPRRLVTSNAPLRYVGRVLGVEVEIGEPPLAQRIDLLETLALDTLKPPGHEEVSSRYEAHDLSTLGGLVTCAAALMLSWVK